MIVIPMAGESRRFAEAGYRTPKYGLPLLGRPLFDWSVASFAARFASERFVFVLRDTDGARDFVAARCAALGIRDASLVVLAAPTAGQAETVGHGLDQAGVDDAAPVGIFNIDTIRPCLDPRPPRIADGWVETFAAAGEGWSFVEPDPDDPRWVRRCTEKVRISDHCCTGFYQFASAALFRRALAAERRRPTAAELYVAPLYNQLIAQGARIGWREAPAAQVILSGVPAEYEAARADPPPALRSLARLLDRSGGT